jgi:arylsulfatase A-like enzyme
VISIDDLRFDCVSCERDKRFLKQYGVDSLVDTPVLDRIAKRGIRFTQCVSTSSYTPAPHASLVTGQYPHTHKVRTFFDLLPQSTLTLPEILKAKGWKTTAWTEHLTLKMQKITRGIDRVVEPLIDEQADLFGFLNGLDPEQKNFVFIHLFDVHKPYYYTTGGKERSPYNEGYREKMEAFCEGISLDCESTLEDACVEARRIINNFDTLSPSLQEYGIYRSFDYLIRNHLRHTHTFFEKMISLYIEGVNKFDQGKLKDLIETLEKNGFLENGLLFILSDHGETRCTWGGKEDFMNSFNVSEGAIHVPCILYADDLPSRTEIDSSISITDIVPTIMEHLTITGNFTFDGCSCTQLIESTDRATENRTLYSESWSYKGSSTFFGESEHSNNAGELLVEACARNDEFKYIWRDKQIGDDGFFNHKEDPFETCSLPMDRRAEILKKEVLNYMLPYQLKKMNLPTLLGPKK